MNGFVNTLLSVTLSWIRALITQIWQVLNSKDGGSLFQFMSANWLKIVIGLCVLCMLVDVIVYFFRWRPDYVWASRLRRFRRKRPEAAAAPEPVYEPQPAPVFPTQTYAPLQPVTGVYAPAAQPTQMWQPLTEEEWQDADAMWESDEPMELEWTPQEEPAFGAPQPEPLAYFRDVQAGFAPAVPPEKLYARPEPVYQTQEPEMVHPGLDEETFRQNLGLDENASPSQSPVMYAPVFHPFTAVHEPEPEKPQGAFQRFAQRAKGFMALDDEQRSIRDLQSSVDVSKAFHEPVYPRSFNRDEE